MAFISSIELLPAPKIYSQAALAEVLGKQWQLEDAKLESLKKLFSKTGIEQRGSFFDHFESEESLSAFLKANPNVSHKLKLFNDAVKQSIVDTSRAALNNSGWSAKEITHLITVSCTGIMAPGLDSLIPDWLKLQSSVERFGIYFSGCYAGVKAIRLARQLANAHIDAKILIVCAEACTLHFPEVYSQEGALSSALFSDGVVSLTVSSKQPLSNHWEIKDALTLQIPDSENLMSWEIDTQNFIMGLAREVPDKIEEALKELDPYELGRYYAIHPGGPKILEKVGSALAIPDEVMAPSFEVLRDSGNMSSGTIFHILKKQRELNKASDEPFTMMAFGPGLTMEKATGFYHA